MINVTDEAATRIQGLLDEEGKLETHGLRMKVVGGGCSGLQYELSFDHNKTDADTDVVVGKVHVRVDEKSALYLAGSTLERSGFDKTTSDSALEELRETASALVPVLASLPVERQWAGLRPGTENGVPYVCEVDDVEGLYLHAGHYRNGIVLGPASVQLMTELVLGKETFCDASPYRMAAPH